MRARLHTWLVGLVVVSFVVAGSAGGTLTPLEGGTDTNEPLATNAQSGQTECNYERLYDETVDSVVTIRISNQQGEFALGSGFVVDDRGYIVTNNHVVSNGLLFDVQFANGEWRTARVVGTDFYSDLAVLKVPSLPDGIDSLRIVERIPNQGDEVAALGSPLGLRGTMTRGIVSATDRSITYENRTVVDTVQIDAPISPGNSGGPLINCDGNVVGVNSAGVEGTDLNFAISATMVSRVVPALVRNGTYNHSYLGIQGISMSPMIARVNGLDVRQGVFVIDVVAGSPASRSLRGSPSVERVTGIPVGGDAIVAIDGTQVQDLEDLEDYLFEHTRPGQTVTLTVIREGERRKVRVRLTKRPLPPGSTPDT